MINYKNIAEVILNITFISIIIAVMFFTYGKDVERAIVENQSSNIAEDLANDAKLFFPQKEREYISSLITIPEEKDDNDVLVNNSILVSRSILMCSILGGIGIIITFVICFFGKVNILHVLLNSLVILAIAVMTEVVFLNVIARNYRSADENFVKLQIVKSIKSELLFT